MKNKLKKLLTISITVLCMFSTLFVGNVNAKSSYGPKNATYSTGADLINNKENSLGKTIYMYTGNADKHKTLVLTKESDHLYCVQHRARSYDALMVVDAYVKIEGQDAIGYKLKKTSTVKKGKVSRKGTIVKSKTISSSENLVVSYILSGKYEKYRKGYHWLELKDLKGNIYKSGEVRRAAIHSYFNTWLPNVGNKLGVSTQWNHKWDMWASGNFKTERKEASKLLVRAKNYAKNTNNYKPKIENAGDKKLNAVSVNTAGPFKVKYTGKIKNITVTDVNGSVIKSGITFSTDKAGKRTVAAKNVKSGTNYYIQNKSNSIMGNVQINLQENEYLTSEIWFLERMDGQQAQRIIKVKDGSKKEGASIKIPISKPLGSITITKTDKDTKQKLDGAKFKLYYESGKNKKNKNWVTGKAEATTHGYNANYESAKPYEAKNGTITVSNLKPGTYHVYEVKAPAGYKLAKQENYIAKYKRVDLKTIVVKVDTKKTINVKLAATNLRDDNALTIIKTDKDNPNIKLRAGFKIYCNTTKGWLLGKKGSYTYKNSEKAANKKPYYTSAKDGTLTLEELAKGKYTVYEIVPPEGYDLTTQPGYDKNKKWVKVGTKSLTDKIKTVAFSHTNKKPDKPDEPKGDMSIAGFVWIDEKDTKGNNYDYLYNEAQKDKKLAGVTVNLREKASGKIVATTVTDANGSYKFENKVTQSKLNDYYVEFNYSEMNNADYRDYLPVDFNATDANGSRAIKKETGIATVEDLSRFNNFYDSNSKTLNYINLGLRYEKHGDPDIEENLAYVNIKMNGYDYRYDYGGDGDKSRIAAPKVSWQSKENIKAYTRLMYPSDVRYSEDHPNALNVSVTYRIDILNKTNTNNANYKEIAMYVTKLTNTYDVMRYTLADDNWEEEKGTMNAAEVKTVKLKDNVLKDTYGKGIEPNKYAKTMYITFDVRNEAIKAMLDEVKYPQGIIEEHPTKAIATEKHKYLAREQKEKDGKIVDEDVEHETKEEQRDDTAPYLIFRLGQDRTISGKVFEDKVTAESASKNEKLGNGLYDNGENLVKDVKVELLNSDKSTVTSLRTKEKPEGFEASTQTNEKGEFTLAGIVPGKYYLRFTYGDGTQVLCDTNGNIIKEKNENEEEIDKKIYVKDYKSTIVTASDVIQKAFNTPNDDKWFIGLGNHSIAVDDLEKRKVDNQTTMEAHTPRASIPVENTLEDKSQVEADGKLAANENSEKFGGFNFGIITQPKQEVKVDKLVTNMKLTNAQNNIVFEGNPSSTKMKGVSDLYQKSTEGSNYVRAELAESSIYGSTLVLTYGIKVTNNSDVNYYNKDYYYYGKSNPNKEVTLNIKEVTDYLDPTLKYLKDSSEKANPDNIKIVEDGTIDREEDGVTAKVTQIKITGLGTLYTTKSEKADDKPTSKTVKLLGQRILSNQDSDMEIVNEAQATSAEVAADQDDNDKDKDSQVKIAATEVNLKEVARATVTITPPTGADKQSMVLYGIAGATMLAILSAAIVVIKKKIL